MSNVCAKVDPNCKNCNKAGLAILPVRYAAVPKGMAAKLPAPLEASRIKEVKAGKHYQYALRTLRQGYLYVFLEDHWPPRRRRICFSAVSSAPTGSIVSPPTARFGCSPTPSIPRPSANRRAATASTSARLSVLAISRADKSGPVWIAFAEHAWSQDTLARYAKDAKLRASRMQKVDPQDWIASQKHEDGLAATQDNFKHIVEHHPAGVADLLPYPQPKPISMTDGAYFPEVLKKVTTFHQVTAPAGTAKNTLAHMEHICSAEGGKKYPPMILALHDPIGITHELNGFYNDVGAWVREYHLEQELLVTALQGIVGMKTTLENQAEADWQTRRKLADDYTRTHQNGPAGIATLKQRASTLPEPQRSYWLSDIDQVSQWEAQGVPTSVTRRLTSPSYALPNLYKSSGWQDSAQRPALEKERNSILKNAKDEADAFINGDKGHAESRRLAWADFEDKFKPLAWENYQTAYNKFKDKAIELLDERAVDLVAWLKAPLLIDALEDFHPGNLLDGRLFEDKIATALFGLGGSTAGKQLLNAWVKEACASNKSNLVWRTIALNNEMGIKAVDEMLAYAKDHKALALTEQSWKAFTNSAKLAKGLADTYKKAFSVVTVNAKIDAHAAGAGNAQKAFQVALKPFRNKGADAFVVSVGDAIFREFVVLEKTGDFVGEKVIQHMLSLRAMVDPEDSNYLILKQAVAEGASRAKILERFGSAKALLNMDQAMAKEVQSAELRAAWERFKGGAAPTNPKAVNEIAASIKDVRLASIVGLLECVNLMKLGIDCANKGKDGPYMLFMASAMSIAAAVCDVGGVLAKNVFFSEAIAYQRLKFYGGGLSATASWIGSVSDFLGGMKQLKKDHIGLASLYFLKSAAGAFAGFFTFATTFTYSAQLIGRVTGREAIVTAGKKAGEKATEIIARRILFMSVGGWVTFVTFVVQGLIIIFTPNPLKEWCKNCAFGKNNGENGYKTPIEQMKSLDEAWTEYA